MIHSGPPLTPKGASVSNCAAGTLEAVGLGISTKWKQKLVDGFKF
jgi:hypothetical protein